jgi:hypothetical protein
MPTVTSNFIPVEFPTVNDQHSDAGVQPLSLSDQAEINAWYDAKEIPPTDEDLDRMWAEEMIRRDEAQRATEQFIAGLAQALA